MIRPGVSKRIRPPVAIGSRAGRWTAPLFAALALSACASDYGPPINGQRALSPEEQRLQSVENKTVDLSRRLAAMESAQSGSQADELRNMRGQMEQLRHDLDVLQQGVQQQNADLDARLKRIEAGSATQAAAPGTDPNASYGAGNPPPATVAVAPAPASVAAAPAPAPAAPAAASTSAEEESIYLKSFDQMRAGKYDPAIAGFRAMLGKFPQGNYADNAWYWTGQCYRAKLDDSNALKAYQALLTQFPASPKVPDALLQTGVIYQAQQKTQPARDAYQKVLKQYPSSSAAVQARTRLAQLK